ncbi:MAG: site-specific DNA-methyltransferase [Methanospirillaceae archaeon]|nr:site-specific DNA-methyltransferase [Methanospirillaceae archaeon]
MGRRRHKKRELNEYILLREPLSREAFAEEEVLIAGLARTFYEADFFWTFEEGDLVCYLHEMEPGEVRDFITGPAGTAVLKRYAKEQCRNPFITLLEKICAIGSYGIKGGRRIFVGYADERKVISRKKKAEERGAYYYTTGHPFTRNNKALPEEYRDTIICGDSEEVLKRLPDNCIDIIITSPPYNFGLDYESDKKEDAQVWEQYFQKLFAVFLEGIRVLKWGGRIIVNVQPLFSEYIPIHHIISHFFMEHKLIWKGEIIWEKNNYNCKYTSWGSWKSPSSPYLKYTWEFIEIYCKGDLKKTGEKEEIDISDEEFKSWVVAKWSIGTERRMKQFDHPAMFPEELVERCLKLFSYQGDVILDPFNGAGTTTAVAQRLKRHYIGIDISSQYCATAEERLKKDKKIGDQLVLF